MLDWFHLSPPPLHPSITPNVIEECNCVGPTVNLNTSRSLGLADVSQVRFCTHRHVPDTIPRIWDSDACAWNP